MENDNNTVDQDQKTFTQAELDKIVTNRVAREREKYSDYQDLQEKAKKFDEIEESNKSELEKLTEKNNSLATKLKALTAQNTLRDAQDKVAADTGLPISVVKTLSGSTVDELTQSAQAILDFSKSQGYPKVKNSSSHKGQSLSKKEQFGEWLKQELN